MNIQYIGIDSLTASQMNMLRQKAEASLKLIKERCGFADGQLSIHHKEFESGKLSKRCKHSLHLKLDAVSEAYNVELASFDFPKMVANIFDKLEKRVCKKRSRERKLAIGKRKLAVKNLDVEAAERLAEEDEK
jgi:hypothetical protein